MCKRARKLYTYTGVYLIVVVILYYLHVFTFGGRGGSVMVDCLEIQIDFPNKVT